MAALLVTSDDALAARIHGTELADSLSGTQKADQIFGLGGVDTMIGGKGNDRIFGHGGRDSFYGGDNDDYIDAVFFEEAFPESDFIDCGAGFDTVKADRRDSVLSNCEKVIRV